MNSLLLLQWDLHDICGELLPIVVSQVSLLALIIGVLQGIAAGTGGI